MTFQKLCGRWQLIAFISFGVALLSLLQNQAIAYDPWCWLIWGREVIHTDLNTDYGPSWKPLPMLFTVPAAVFGSSVAPLLWLLLARAGTVAASCLAFIITKRFSNTYAGILAALVIFFSPRWFYQNGLGNSEGIMAFFALLVFLWSLEKCWGRAFAAAVCVGLLRPEAWPFLFVYAVWLWRKDHLQLRWVLFGLCLQPLLWFGPELLLAGDPFRASERARVPPPGSPALADRPAFVVLKNLWYMTSPVVVFGLLVFLVQARERKNQPLRVFFFAGFAWLLLVAFMTEAGYSGNERYGLLTLVCVSIVGSAGVGLLLQSVTRRYGRLVTAFLAALVMLSAATVVSAGRYDLLQGLSQRQKSEHSLSGVVQDMRYRQLLQGSIGPAIERAGGRQAVLGCGQPVTDPYFVPYVAWHLQVHIREVKLKEAPPVVLIRARQNVDKSATPPLGGLAENENLNQLTRYKAWEIVGVCR